MRPDLDLRLSAGLDRCLSADLGHHLDLSSGRCRTLAPSKRPRGPAHHPEPAKHVTAPVGALPVSSASGSVVQPQPAPGSCHAKGSGPYSEPDPKCTPGALNPAVTQDTIDRTICKSGWT